MARDLMDLGIHVNSIMPRIFATPPILAVKERSVSRFETLAALRSDHLAPIFMI